MKLTFKLIYKSLKEKKIYAILFFIFSILNAYFVTLIPLIISYGINYIFNQTTSSYLINFISFYADSQYIFIIYCCLALLAIKLISVLLIYARNCFKDKFLFTLQFNLKHYLFFYIQELTYKNFFSNTTADLVQKASGDTDNINNFISTQMTFILDVILLIVFSGLQLIKVHFSFMLIVFISFTLIIILSFWYYFKCIPFVNEIIDNSNDIYSSLEDIYRNIKYVKLMNNKQEILNNIDDKFNQARNLNRKRYYYDNLYYCYITNILRIQKPISYIIGAFLIYLNKMSVSSIIAVVDYSSRIVGSFNGFQHIIEQFNSFNISCKRINKLLSYESEENDNYKNEIYNNYDIVLQNVSIKINDSKNILQDVNFKIKQDEKVLILGKTGSGKSILLKTLIGFYDYNGSIKINDTELSEINKKQLRDNISLVLQDSYIYSKTIEDNIKILNPTISFNNVILNSKKFKLHDEIIKLKEKYKTKIGYGGIKLSKGQNQRLVLARSFIGRRNIMIFDDSFSAIDNKNKKDILNNLLNDDNKFTLIIATNDISIAPKFDKIVFIDDHKVICGTHKNLLKNKNYKKVWEISQNLIGENYE